MRYLGLELPAPEHVPRYNIAPGAPIALIAVDRAHPERLEIVSSLWGFHPPWAGPTAPTPINAKAETVASSRYFRNAFAHRRALIPADGWYEWRVEQGGKQPYFIHRRDGEPVLFAAIWEPGEEAARSTCAIITQPAQPAIANIHPRMPALLDAEAFRAWLDPAIVDLDQIRTLARPLAQELLEAYPVTRAVNRAANEGPALVEPA
jgi:putative SOS response-associated peptidase YedK